MPSDKELMQQALEALVYMTKGTIHGGNDLTKAAIAALRERLAQHEALDKLVAIDQELGMFEQPVQEPVAWTHPGGPGEYVSMYRDEYHTIPLYTAPQPRQWVNLTDADIHNADPNPHNRFDAERLEFGRRLEAVMREKNHG